MPFSLFLLGALIGAVVGGYCCYCLGRDKRDELKTDNSLLETENKRLWRMINDCYDLIKMQRRYIEQIDKPYTARKEGSECDPFTDF